ncbi:hypothetical protein GOP47_0001220 [Adiantum capillus-veneris]|uniref:BURP domain-containing protein n=1 Tax=Adiantum capillus-veneris TaxID=13818 RepID=A0A9D4VEF4_ADICA|nr:hypothetical protein GOP47_0001220 [Adiantum capillus-veneris]
MAGLRKLSILQCLLAAHFVLAAALLALLPVAKASSLSSFWHHELPLTSIPDALQKLASPLSARLTRHYLTQLKAGTLKASQSGFCSSAGIYCSQKATPISTPITTPITGLPPGVQPRVCVPPFFFYEYGVLRCRQHGASRSTASAVQLSSSIFFAQDSLTVGKVVQLPDTSNDLKGLRFLPHSLAKALPKLNEGNKQALAEFYGVAKGSDMEFDMVDTLAHCAYKSEHELKACLTSGEGMVSFIAKAVGHKAVVYAPGAVAMQEAQVIDVKVVSSKGSRVASCHDMKFPSLLYSCHMTKTSELIDVSVKLADGHVAHMPAICHMDTSYWNPSHIAFQVLNVEPGKTSICHWLPQNSFVFVQGTN